MLLVAESQMNPQLQLMKPFGAAAYGALWFYQNPI